DLFAQVRASIVPFFAPGSLAALAGGFGMRSLLEALKNPVLVVGVVTVLVYFFFSVPHKGPVGAAAEVGVWFLMVSFGASYGNRVRARISLFIGRSEYLLVEESAGWPHRWITLALGTVLVVALAAWQRRRGSEEPG